MASQFWVEEALTNLCFIITTTRTTYFAVTERHLGLLQLLVVQLKIKVSMLVTLILNYHCYYQYYWDQRQN